MGRGEQDLAGLDPAQKSGEPVFLPIAEPLKLALVGIAERTLAAVFKKSGVKNAHAHHFRHTLATKLLAQGASFERVADLPGFREEALR